MSQILTSLPDSPEHCLPPEAFNAIRKALRNDGGLPDEARLENLLVQQDTFQHSLAWIGLKYDKCKTIRDKLASELPLSRGTSKES